MISQTNSPTEVLAALLCAPTPGAIAPHKGLPPRSTPSVATAATSPAEQFRSHRWWPKGFRGKCRHRVQQKQMVESGGSELR